jgi:outer membrane protein OmpA-like peptidoglycan-associated protein
LALLATQRFYAYVQAGIGYRGASPKEVDTVDVSGKDDVAILAGGGLEYYSNLRHFSFALEANATILPIRGDVVVSLIPVVRYTFGFGEVRFIKPPKDRDHDGVPDKDDKCPDEWGPESNKGCPEKDTDGDGIIDREDHCPEEPGPASNAGCPIEPDSDNDGVPDKLDRCPKVPGPKDKEGCPDRDDDGIPDHIDKCPDKPGRAEADGCPTKAHVKVTVKQRSLELREKIHFEFGKAVIKQKSNSILNQVVATLKEHSEIKKLRIEGHTDSKGSREYNQGLSQRRAQAVVNFMVNIGGINRDRLVAKGFGEDKPIASNATARGRSLNRRVEMIILERE